MSFEHLSTFLRSTLVRDPFSLGGLIGPEDVIRLEEKYPVLFDKAKPSTEEETQKETEEVPEEKAPSVDPRVKGATKDLPQKAEPSAEAKEKKKVVSKVVSAPAAATRGKKPTISQFHRKCLESSSTPNNDKPVRLRASPRKAVSRAETGSAARVGTGRRRPLSRPAQSFSLEDLRETLKQVMKDEKSASPSSKRAQVSPYTEDLVKKFLGRKLHELQSKKKKGNSSANVNYGIVMDNTELEKAVNSSLTFVPIKPTQSISRGNVKALQKGKVHAVRSAPGFLRGFSDLPPAPVINYQKRNKGSHTISSSKAESPTKKGESNCGDGPSENEKHVSWAKKPNENFNESSSSSSSPLSERSTKSPRNYQKDAVAQVKSDEFGSSRQETDSMESSNTKSIPSAKVDKGRRGTNIFIRKTGRPSNQDTQNSQLAHGSRFIDYTPSSNFHQMAFRSDVGKLEAKRLLRKEETQTNFLIKETGKQTSTKSVRKHWHRAPPADPTGTEKLVDPESVKMKTTRVLETIAEELVYMEILHQLREIKQEQINEKPKRDIAADSEESRKSGGKERKSSRPKKPDSIPLSESNASPRSSPKFVPTPENGSGTSSEKDSPSQVKRRSTSPSSIILKTPELTPPSAVTPRQNCRRNLFQEGYGDKRKNEVKLNTPDLSPSPRKEARQKLEALKAKQAQQQQLVNVETDCSEMSDFVLSDQLVPTQDSGKEKETGERKEKEESIRLDTPQFSKSVSQPVSEFEQQQDRSHVAVEPEKDIGTLSGVSSTFKESANSVKAGEVKEEISARELLKKSDVDDNPSKYSDDFLAESETSKDLNSSTLLENKTKEEDKVEDQLNMSGETVIDLLSEGEFLGRSYRSPGELSRRSPPDKRAKVSSSKTSSGLVSSTPKKDQGDEEAGSDKEFEESETSVISLDAHAQVLSEADVTRESISIGEYLIP